MAVITGTINNDTITTTSVSAGVVGGPATIGPDTINAGNGDDYVYAGDGNDSIRGQAGYDNLHGEAGNDTVDGGFGSDTLYGEAGDDSLLGGNGEDDLYGGDGSDTLVGGAGDDYLQGNQGADTYVLTMAGGQDRIYNYDNDSSIDTATFTDVATTDVKSITRYGNDLVLAYGVAGGQLTVDSYFTSDNAAYRVDVFDFTNADWTVTEIKNQVVTKGTESNDNISGYNSGPNKIFAYGGNDAVYGGDGNDSLDGGAGNDNIRGYAGNDTLLGQNGADTLYGSDGSDSLIGGAGDDYLQGDQGADTYEVELSDGHDLISNYDSDNAVDVVHFTDVTLCDLRDALRISNNFVLSYGNDSQLTVQNHFSSASYQLGQFQFADGATIDTVIMGTGLNETLMGAALSNDLIVGAGGADTMKGLSGDDVYFTDGGDSIVEAAGSGTDTVLSSVTMTLGAQLENLVLLPGAVNGTGNTLNNLLCGNDVNNRLNGGAGNDTLNGGDGNDRLTGAAGADRLNGEGGNDVMIGGGGNDTYMVDSAGDVVSETASPGTDTVQSSLATYTLTVNVERLTLTGVADIDGNGNVAGNTLIGNSGANNLDGKGGADILYGKGGNDTLTGGAQNDIFVFDTALNGVTNVDHIVAADFVSGADRIQLENAIFAKFASAGALPAGTFVANAGGMPGDANDYLRYDTSTGNLYYDTDGNGGADPGTLFAVLDNHPTLVAGDFSIT